MISNVALEPNAVRHHARLTPLLEDRLPKDTASVLTSHCQLLAKPLLRAAFTISTALAAFRVGSRMHRQRTEGTEQKKTQARRERVLSALFNSAGTLIPGIGEHLKSQNSIRVG
eukprot:8636600-Pyramimonas_sp.AAC.1